MENEKEFEAQGFCPYCGQGVMIKTSYPVETQEELDQIAADRCGCQKASEERRKRSRREKIENYLKKHFDENMGDFIKETIELVQSYDIDRAAFTLGARNVSIWMDADAYLHVKIKHKSDDELKV
ncbi:MAG: hypothetical protein K6F00_05035 [Lachnospiraceae bacterium]|nr:hypothetical protein [Lachnospiraceae bacterium]